MVNLLLLKNYLVVGVYWGVWVECYLCESVVVDEVLMCLVGIGELCLYVGCMMFWEEFVVVLDFLCCCEV